MHSSCGRNPAIYFTSFRRSALSRLSLVIAMGVSNVTGFAGLVPLRRNATNVCSAPLTWPPGNCSIVPVMLPALICPSASGKASKPISFYFAKEIARLQFLERAKRHVVVRANDDIRGFCHAREGRLRHRKTPRSIEASGILKHNCICPWPDREHYAVPCCGR